MSLLLVLSSVTQEIETFESGTAGNAYTVTSGLSDSGASGTGTLNYDTAAAFEGSLGVRLSAASGSTLWRRNLNVGSTLNTLYLVTSFRYDVLPLANTPILASFITGTGNTAQVCLTPTGTLKQRNGTTGTGGTGAGDSTTTLSANTWYTIELAVDVVSASIQTRIWDANSTLLETLAAGSYTGGQVDQCVFGMITAAGAVAINWDFDRVGYSSADWVGPPPPPVVSINASETITFADAVVTFSASFTSTETLALGDTTGTRSATFAATENLLLTDAFSALAASFSGADTLTLTDVVDTLNTGGGGPVPISASETLTLTDAVSLLTVSLSATETLTFLDAVGARSATLTASEALSLADAAGTTSLTAAETLTLLDQTLNVSLSAAEVLALADARGATALSANETLSFAENYTDRTLSSTDFLLLNDAVGALVKTGGPGVVLMLLPYRRRPRRNTYGVANTREAP